MAVSFFNERIETS